jgi:hypothetical protein
MERKEGSPLLGRAEDGPTSMVSWRVLLSVLALAFTGCGVVRFDDGTLAGKRAALDEIHRLLTSGECTQAQIISQKLYDSAETVDNEVRYAHMAALACSGGVSNLLSLVIAIANNSGTLAAPGGLWAVSTQLFYQSSLSVAESRFNAGIAASEAGSAILNPGVVVSLTNLLNADSANPGSASPDDREASANLYKVFVSLANLGNAQTRYGAPNSVTFSNGATFIGATASNPFGWSLVSAVDESACAYAASVVELIDTISAASSTLPSAIGGTLATVATLYGSELDTACNRACQGLGSIVAHPVDYSGLGCPLVGNDRLGCVGPDGTRPCLSALRNRKLCATQNAQTVVDDQARCAAAGISHYISTHPALGWL